MINQDELRTQIKIACACNDDIKLKDFADYIDIKEHSFYNFLSGYYNLSESNARRLYDVTIDLIDL